MIIQGNRFENQIRQVKRIWNFNFVFFLIKGNDCTLENLTVENTAGRVGQAVALHIKSDRVAVKNCNLLGNQDTLYLSEGNTALILRTVLSTEQ